jgi:hypothetical protein
MTAAQKLKPAQPHKLPPSKPDFVAERQVLENEREGESAHLELHTAALDVLLDANFEIAEMALELAKRADDNSDVVSRGMAMRIANLNLLAHRILSNDSPQDVHEIGRTVYGPGFLLGRERP